MLAHDRPPPTAEMTTTYAYLPVVIAAQSLVLLRNIVADNGNKCGAIETMGAGGPERSKWTHDSAASLGYDGGE